MTLPAERYRAAIRDEADALVDAAERAGLDAPVPPCPEWDVAGLLRHVGRVHRWAAANVEANDFVPPHTLPESPGPDELAQWVRDGADALVAAVDRPSSDPAWTFVTPDGTVGFWQRRQAHETAVHRVDAELAAGAPRPVAGDLAADGIDEWLALLPFRPNATLPSGRGETLHLHCTDRDGEWLIRLTEAAPEIERTHAKGDVAVRGPASDLLLVLLRRADPHRVEVLGERGVLEGFLSHTAF
jgi:uncharacterized protein (TIGR03083 family)